MRYRAFRKTHPLLCDAIVWACPAILCGLILRLIFLHYSPYAYWGSDSRSFFGFTDGVLDHFYFSINEKRRYLYPVILLPISLLPGGTLRWLGWIQAGLGLATILPFAYAVRRIFANWRWFIIPLTLIYAGMPTLIWHEHELIADTIFYNCLVWALGGWMAWTLQSQPSRARRLFWWFLIPMALMILTKPSGVLFWPGIFAGLLLIKAWKILRWPHWTALALTVVVGFTSGDKKQSAWLLYITAFPLTQLDTPLHADYKSQIRDLVEKKRSQIAYYSSEEEEINRFLRGPGNQKDRPLWRDLDKEKGRMVSVYHDLALEGIRAHPDLFLLIGLQRLLGCANPGDFRDTRFDATYSARHFKEAYDGKRIPESMTRIAFGIPKSVPYPTYEELRQRLAPYPDSAAAEWLRHYAKAYNKAGQLVHRPKEHQQPVTHDRPTVLGWWLVAGLILSFLTPWRRTLGVWALATLGYLWVVYLIGIQETRYFAAAWPVIILLLAVLPDGVMRLVMSWINQTRLGGMPSHCAKDN